MEPQHLRFDQGRGVYTKRDCWQGKNNSCVPEEGRFGCFACSMWSYVSTWRATVDDGRVNNADVFQLRYRRQKGLSMHGMCSRLRG